MPELPEVETVRRIIAHLIIGHTIERVRVSQQFPCVLESLDGIEPVPTLTGSNIIDVQRRGKYLMFELDSGLWMIVHLRMTGRLVVVERDAPPVRFEHLALELDNRFDLRFGDQRKFGRVTVVSPDAAAALSARLGLEPLETQFTSAWLHNALSRRTGKIKAVLLDQHLIAGLGNIYVDESLFRARINPFTPARDLSPQETQRLVEAIQSVLTSAIENKGTTFSTFENPYGEPGSNADHLMVYGKGRRREACPRCGTSLEFGVVGGRGTTWCPKCQAAHSGLADQS